MVQQVLTDTMSQQLNGYIVDPVEAASHLLVDDPVLPEGQSRVKPLLQLPNIILYDESLNVPPSLLIEVYLSPIDSCIHHILEIVFIREVQALPFTLVSLLPLAPAA